MQVITPAVKDDILSYICIKCPPENFFKIDTEEILRDIECDFNTLDAILSQFQRLNFLSKLGVGDTTTFVPHLEATDFKQRGGFVAQEEIFETNIKRLLLEVDNLKKQLSPDQLETANKISSIASAIFSGLALLHK